MQACPRCGQPMPCPECNGRGYVPGDGELLPCPVCCDPPADLSALAETHRRLDAENRAWLLEHGLPF